MKRLGLLLVVTTVFTSMNGLPSKDVLAGDAERPARIVPFGNNGKFKMLYDARQRPQSVFFKNRLFVVFNGDAKPTANGNGRAHPMLIVYDPVTRTFSEPNRLGPSRSDHHDSPIIWADRADHLHVLYGCHKTPGTHLISKRPILARESVGAKESGQANEPVRAEEAAIAWVEGPQIAPKISYPTVFRISDDRDLIYYRTDGHTSSWTYRISRDNGHTWSGPESDVTDLDSRGKLDWSSYQTKAISRDGRYLHVVYTDYDDNKHQPRPERFYNPRYRQEVSNEWKYNLSYVKIDLVNRGVYNAEGQKLRTPIDIDYSRQRCMIWDTDWRGAGVPPAVCLDHEGQPTFLHVLSRNDLKSHWYYYVRCRQGEWIQSPICPSTHQWNSCYLSRDPQGGLHAFVIVGEKYLEGGYMDRHGGGRLEEWESTDAGDTWKQRRVLSPGEPFANWKFNNAQPVVRPDGSEVQGMLLFYGWNDSDAPQARAFLLDERRLYAKP